MALSTQARSLALTPTIAPASYSDGQLLWQPEEVSGAVFQKGRIAQLFGVSGFCNDNVTLAFDLLFFQATADLGTVGAALDLADASVVAAAPLGFRSIVAADTAAFASTGKLITHDAKGALMLQAALESSSLWVAGVARGAMTLTANSLALRLLVKWW